MRHSINSNKVIKKYKQKLKLQGRNDLCDMLSDGQTNGSTCNTNGHILEPSVPCLLNHINGSGKGVEGNSSIPLTKSQKKRLSKKRRILAKLERIRAAKERLEVEHTELSQKYHQYSLQHNEVKQEGFEKIPTEKYKISKSSNSNTGSSLAAHQPHSTSVHKNCDPSSSTDMHNPKKSKYMPCIPLDHQSCPTADAHNHTPALRTSHSNAETNHPETTGWSNTDMLPPYSLQSACLPSLDEYVALDCEFVGVGPGKLNGLARCSLVDFSCHVMLDLYVRPEEPITDYRTPWSGIRPKHMKKAVPYHSARSIIRKYIKNKIIVGHSVHNDFKVLKLHHPPHMVRDTSRYQPLKEKAGFTDKVVSLKRLTWSLLGYRIQQKEHCSVEDSQATMCLFKLVHTEWETKLRTDIAAQAIKNQNRVRTSSLRSSISEDEGSFLKDCFWPSDCDGDSEEL